MAWLSVGNSNEDLCNKMKNHEVFTDGPIYDAFKQTDRGDFVASEDRALAYHDRPFKKGSLHISAPHMYATILEYLELKPGMSFLNIGSGSGYLSCLVASLLGPGGLCHGIEICPTVVEAARKNVIVWKEKLVNAPQEMLEFEFAFVAGNCFDLDLGGPQGMRYDRIYVGAGCPEAKKEFFYPLLTEGGLLVLPIDEKNQMVQVKRLRGNVYSIKHVSNVYFAPLVDNGLPLPAALTITSTTQTGTPLARATATTTAAVTTTAASAPSAAATATSSNSNGNGSGNGAARRRSSSMGSNGSSSSSHPHPHAHPRRVVVGAADRVLEEISSSEPSSLVILNSQLLLQGTASSTSSPRSSRDEMDTTAMAPDTVARSTLGSTTMVTVGLRSRSGSVASSTGGGGGGGPSTLPGVLHPIYLPRLIWQPDRIRHQQFPVEFREIVKLMLLAANRSPFHYRRGGGPGGGGGGRGGGAAAVVPCCVISWLPLSVWYEILSYMRRDWFVTSRSELDLLRAELAAERRLRRAAESKVQQLEMGKKGVERERDLFRVVMMRMGLVSSSSSSGGVNHQAATAAQQAMMLEEEEDEEEEEESEEEEELEVEEGEEEEEEEMDDDEDEDNAEADEEDHDETEDAFPVVAVAVAELVAAISSSSPVPVHEHVDDEQEEEQEEEPHIVTMANESQQVISTSFGTNTTIEDLDQEDENEDEENEGEQAEEKDQQMTVSPAKTKQRTMMMVTATASASASATSTRKRSHDEDDEDDEEGEGEEEDTDDESGFMDVVSEPAASTIKSCYAGMIHHPHHHQQQHQAGRSLLPSSPIRGKLPRQQQQQELVQHDLDEEEEEEMFFTADGL